MIELHGKVSVDKTIELQGHLTIQNLHGKLGYQSAGSIKLQAKQVAPQAEPQSVTPDVGFMGLSEVVVDGAPLQEKVVNPSIEETTVMPDVDFYGMSKVVVSPMVLQEKTIAPTTEQIEVVPDDGNLGLSKVIVEEVGASVALAKWYTSKVV